jgi:hypothetical protein
MLTSAPVAARPPEPDGEGAQFRALEAAARAHAVAAEAERCAAEVFRLLDTDQLGEAPAPDAALLIRDARLRARAGLASAHTATGDLAAAASGLAIALRRVTEYADLHRRAREATIQAGFHGAGGMDGDGPAGA